MYLDVFDWSFDVDITATMIYSAAEASQHCLCAYCRNFYASIDSVYPELRGFLGRFGLNLEAPDEMVPYFPPTDCDVFYSVRGKILSRGNQPIFLQDLIIRPMAAADVMVNTEIEEPFFFLKLEGISLPWILDEPMEDVISPANEEAFLYRAVERKLRELPPQSIYS